MDQETQHLNRLAAARGAHKAIDEAMEKGYENVLKVQGERLIKLVEEMERRGFWGPPGRP